MPAANTLESIFARINRNAPNGCWLWTGCVIKDSYGTVGYQGRPQLVHRLVYETFNGPIPDGYHIDHLCRVRRCCNPAHLEPVTPSENLSRGERGFGLTGYCRKGLHDITQPGAIVTRKRGERTCAECLRDYGHEYWERVARPRRRAVTANRQDTA